MTRTKLLNIRVDNLTISETVDAIDSIIQKKQNAYVVTPNVDHIVKLENDEEFRKVYNDADLVLVDGMPLVWISKLINKPIKEKISGSDLFPRVCEMASKKNYSVFLLGAAEGVAMKAATNLQKKYGKLKIAGTYSPKYGFESDEKEINKIINMITNVKPDILAVGLGAPKQEKFIYRYRDKLNVPISLAIGASIDFEAGHIKRAPIFMQKCGLEWFYRFIKEPRRMFKRYFIEDIKIVKIFCKYTKGVSYEKD